MWEPAPESTEPYRPALVRGRYRVTRVLHQGRRGDVVIAQDNRGGGDVVLKRVFDPSNDDIDRLRLVHAVLSELEHPRVAASLELIEARADAWMVFRRVPGRNLMRWWAELPLLPSSSFRARWRHAAPIVAGLFDGLEALHRRQVAHLDLKPHNVLVGRAGEVSIVDVGLGAEPAGVDTRSLAEIFDRSGYAAPEVVAGGAASRRADQWSLGAILYELVTGQKAVPGHTPVELGRAYRQGRVQPVLEWRPEAPDAVARTIERMLQWDSSDRFSSIGEARRSIEEALEPAADGMPQIWSVVRPPLVGREALDTFLRRRLVELKSRKGSVIRIVDGAGTGKTAILRRWAKEAAQDPTLQVISSSCREGWPRTALHRWFRPPLVDPTLPPPPDLVPQALQRITKPTVLLIDALEESDPAVWARIQRTAGLVVSGQTPRPMMLVLAGRALGGLSPLVQEDEERLFNVSLPPLRPEHVAELLVPREDTVEERSRMKEEAEALCRESRGRPGELIPLLLERERDGDLERRGRFWCPGDAERPPPPTLMPASANEVLTWIRMLGASVEIELVLACLAYPRGELLSVLRWADEAGMLAFREVGDRWMVELTRGSDLPGVEVSNQEKTHERVALWLEHNAEYGGLAGERTAMHWRRAGSTGRTADAYDRAAKAHCGIGSSSDARRLIGLSLTHESRRSPGARTGRHRSMATDPRFRLPEK